MGQWEDPLKEFLAKNNMDKYSGTLAAAGVRSYRDLQALSAQQLDSIDIPIGFKIKIRKELERDRQSEAYVLRQPFIVLEEPLKVEDIVERRRLHTAIQEHEDE